MKKLILAGAMVVLAATATACAGGQSSQSSAAVSSEAASTAAMAETEKMEGAESTQAAESKDASVQIQSETGAAGSSAADDDETSAEFRSTAYAVQNEITTGKTTEYLDGLLNYPVTVDVLGDQTTLNNQDDVKKYGLDKLYTQELKDAVGKADIENLKIENDRAVLGDKDSAYVIINKNKDGYIGVEGFYYVKE